MILCSASSSLLHTGTFKIPKKAALQGPFGLFYTRIVVRATVWRQNGTEFVFFLLTRTSFDGDVDLALVIGGIKG